MAFVCSGHKLQIKRHNFFHVWVELRYEATSGAAAGLETSHFRLWGDTNILNDVINSVAISNSTIDRIIWFRHFVRHSVSHAVNSETKQNKEGNYPYKSSTSSRVSSCSI
jgi:hypothetical protein